MTVSLCLLHTMIEQSKNLDLVDIPAQLPHRDTYVHHREAVLRFRMLGQPEEARMV